MRLFVCLLCLLLSAIFVGEALAQKAKVRREMGLECRAVAAGKASLISFPTRTKTNAVVPVEGILMKPSGTGPFGAVVLLHGGPGIFPPRCFAGAQELFVGWGYAALVVDSFSGGFPEQGREHAPTFEDRTHDAWAAARYLASRKDIRSGSIGVIGWSLGGLTTLMAVSDNMSKNRDGAPAFAAAVAIGPECPSDLQAISTPLLLLHGEDDRSSPVEDCKRMRVTGRESSNYELITYPNAGHTFDLPGSPDYNAQAATDAWRRVRALLEKYVSQD